ncbi:MAG: delta 1-pyrroline-5-carboxylate synthetase [Thiotrichales bacterium]
MRVVKLGGSLAAAPELPRWLHRLGAGGQVIVPGGGPFADQVRVAQRQWAFDDRAAHRMAILAMEQMGWMYAGLEPRLETARSAAGIMAALGRGCSCVWLPAHMLMDDATVEASWRVTSDSLAAWLATRIDADSLMLVKQVSPPTMPLTLRDWQARGVIDEAFHAFAEGARWTWSVRAHDDLIPP